MNWAMGLETYLRWGFWPGIAGAVVTFLGGWAYAIATSGFVLGVGLGWLAAGICAFLMFHIVRWTWLPLAVLVAVASIAIVLTT